MEYFITAGGITVHLCDTDDKQVVETDRKTVILLHGYLETMYIWSEFVNMLKNGYRVITLDLPGHGLTDSAPEDENGESINSMEFCAYVIKSVLDKIGIEKAVIGGHSMGGFIAQNCCIKYPEKFEKLIIFNSTPYKDKEEKAADRLREIEAVRSGKLETLAFLSIPKMYHPDNLRKFDDKIRETVELCETHLPEGIISSIKGMQRRNDTSELLEKCPLPILHISGDTDPFLPAETLERMMKDFTKVKFFNIASSGHNSFIEAEKVCYEQVCEFIG